MLKFHSEVPQKSFRWKHFFFLALTQQIYLRCTEIERHHEIFLYSRPSFSLKLHCQFTCIYQIKKKKFKLKEMITTLGSSLVWLQRYMFSNSLILGQSKVLFHGFFPVFSYLTKFQMTLEHVLSISLRILQTAVRILSPIFLGVQVYCSYSVYI